MFTWIPIHLEAAKRLAAFRQKQDELLSLIQRMHAAGLKALPVMDRDASGDEFPLREIDPFTFLSNFNRANTAANRRALWTFLKKEWDLTAALPDDFDGIPVMSPLKSWFIPFSFRRDASHVTDLWEFFGHALDCPIGGLDTKLMQRCLDHRGTAMTNLTMGMFWIRPDAWISTDGKNIAFAEHQKSPLVKPKNAAAYPAWLAAMKELAGGDAKQFSREAHLWATEKLGKPFDRLFGKTDPRPILDLFDEVIQSLRAAPGFREELMVVSLRKEPVLRINYGDWAIFAYEQRGSQCIQLLLPSDYPSEADWVGSGPFAKETPRGKFNLYWVNEARVLESSHPWEDFLSYLPEVVSAFAHHRSSQYLRWHSPEALEMIIDSDAREAHLKQGIKSSADSAESAGEELIQLGPRRWMAKVNGTVILEEGTHNNAQRAIQAFRKGLAPGSEEFKCYVEHYEKFDPETGSALAVKSAPGFRLPDFLADRNYWLIAPGEGASLWQECLRKGIISIGWDEIGDFRGKSRTDIAEALAGAFPAANPGSHASVSGMLHQFAQGMKPGDIVFAKKGQTQVMGWGIVKGACEFDPDRDEHFHYRVVEWQPAHVLAMPEGVQLPNKTLTPKVRPKDDEFLRILAENYHGIPGISELEIKEAPAMYDETMALAELFIEANQLQTISRRLKEKKNIILQGAPGVGKTFMARRLAHLMLGTRDDSTIEMVQFHQSYSYEDFVQGIKPCPESGNFMVKNGIFHRLCERAASDLKRPYFLIIDEINRGNLAKILGELMMLIEPDKRGHKLTLTYSGESFSVPPNLHLIGTMNTADRSLSMVDYALRRRFSFMTLEPGFHTDAFGAHLVRHGLLAEQIEVIRGLMAGLNDEIAKDVVNLGPGYVIGHSFFTPVCEVRDFTTWCRDIVDHEILPLLEEYWMDDQDTVALHRDKVKAFLS
jgi:hypothetical protein